MESTVRLEIPQLVIVGLIGPAITSAMVVAGKALGGPHSVQGRAMSLLVLSLAIIVLVGLALWRKPPRQSPTPAAK